MGSIDTMPTGQMNGSLASYVVDEHSLGEPSPMRAICIGAGARGLDVAYKIEKRMRNVAFEIYEKNDALGETWLENSWAPNPDWSEFYASSKEIWDHLDNTAKKFGLNKYIKPSHRVVGAVRNADRGVRIIRVRNEVTGDESGDRCHFLVNGSATEDGRTFPALIHSKAPGFIRQPGMKKTY